MEIKIIKRLKLVEQNINKDKRYSSFPKLAATLTGCSQSAIHILDDDTQHCKVSYGKDLPMEIMTKEAPRQLAICSHVLNNNSKPLVISDVSIDERTKHAYALAPGFPRFYAGSPIISKSGFTLGTFCVFDDEPKVLEHSRDSKVTVIKKKRRKGYQRKRGHRQDLTLLQIQSITAAKAKKPAAKKTAKKTEDKK